MRRLRGWMVGGCGMSNQAGVLWKRGLPLALPEPPSEWRLKSRVTTGKGLRVERRLLRLPDIHLRRPKGQLPENREPELQRLSPTLWPMCRPSDTMELSSEWPEPGRQLRLDAAIRRQSSHLPAPLNQVPTREFATSPGAVSASCRSAGSIHFRRSAARKHRESRQEGQGTLPRANAESDRCHKRRSRGSRVACLLQGPRDVFTLVLLRQSTGVMSEKIAQGVSNSLLGAGIKPRAYQLIQFRHNPVWKFQLNRFHGRKSNRLVGAFKPPCRVLGRCSGEDGGKRNR